MAHDDHTEMRPAHRQRVAGGTRFGTKHERTRSTRRKPGSVDTLQGGAL